MLHVVIDTNILVVDPGRKKSAFRAVKQLVDLREMKLYVPQIVLDEFISQEQEKCKEHLNEINKNFAFLGKRLEFHDIDDVFQNFDTLKSTLQNLNSEIENLLRRNFSKWCYELEVTILPIRESHTKNVINDYFQGRHPFRTKKSRNDFPDAFIWQSIVDLLEDVEKLFFITSDKRIQSSINNREIISITTLDEFIGLEVCQDILKGNRAKNIGRLISLFQSEASSFDEVVKKNSLGFFSAFIHDETTPFFKSKDLFENCEVEGGILCEIHEVTDFSVGMDEFRYHGYSSFAIPVKFNTLIDILFVAPVGAKINEKRLKEINQNVDLHYHRDGSIHSIYGTFWASIEMKPSMMFEEDFLEREELPESDLHTALKKAKFALGSSPESSLRFRL